MTFSTAAWFAVVLALGQASGDAGPLDSLTLELQAESQDVLPGEPVLMTLRWRNPGAHPVPVQKTAFFNPDRGAYKLLISAEESGPATEYLTDFVLKYLSPNAHSGIGGPPDTTFGAERTITLQDLIFPAGEGYPFTRSGTYYIRYKYVQGKPSGEGTDRVTSGAPVKLVVREPALDGEKVFSKVMLDPARGYLKCGIIAASVAPKDFARVSKMTRDDIRGELNQLITETAGTAGAQYFRYLLARTYDGSVEELGAACGVYEKILGEKAFPLTPHCYLELADCYFRRGESKRHDDVLQAASGLFATNPAVHMTRRPGWARHR